MRRLVTPVLVAVASLVGSSLSAQVGYLPTESPFRDIRGERWLELSAGRVMGGGGPLKVGPRDGNFGGLRIAFRGNHTLQLGLGGWYAKTVRNIVDADDSVATRVKPAVPHSLLAAEFTIQFNLTGGKSWHAFAPYISGGIGLVKGQNTPAADTSGYAYGTKFYFVPSIGSRIMLSQRLALRVEGRMFFWSLKYPANYSLEPSKEPGTAEHSNAVNTTGKLSQYSPTPAILFGVSVVF